MPVLKQLETYLEENKVRYQTIPHELAYTAQETAQLEHIPGRRMAKVVMVRKNSHHLMAVIPADHRVDFVRLRKLMGCPVELESEKDFTDLFPGCEPGAEPPFGNLFNIEVWVDTTLTENDEILFNAGDHRETVRMRYEDFARLVRPRVAPFARHL